MSPKGATTVVVLTGGVLSALALIPYEGKTGSAYKKLWAAGLLTVALAAAADFVPEIVGPFAVLIIIAAVAKNPGVLGGFLSQAAKPVPAAKKAAAAVAPQGNLFNSTTR